MGGGGGKRIPQLKFKFLDMYCNIVKIEYWSVLLKYPLKEILFEFLFDQNGDTMKCISHPDV